MPSTALTLSEKFDFFRTLTFTVLFAAYAAVAALFRGPDSPPTWKRNFLPPVLRYLHPRVSLRQRRSLRSGFTSDAVREYCEVRGLKHRVVDLEYSAKLHWVGEHDKENDKVLLYIHGGGFADPITSPGHIDFTQSCQEKLQATSGGSLALAFVEYSLAPNAKYPTALIQCVEALRHLINNEPYREDSIVIGGDSAGGNLVLAMISHLMHPHPAIKPLGLSMPLLGCLLVSPWVTMDTDAPSYHLNAGRDYLTVYACKRYKDWYLPEDCKSDNYLEPLKAPVDWWTAKAFPVNKTLLLAGEYEIFRDDVIAMARIFEKVSIPRGGIKFHVCEKQLHVQPVFDIQVKVPGPPMSMSLYAWEWFSSLV